MKLFALILAFVFLAPLAWAQTSAPELRCDEPITRACSAALTELLAARKVIDAQVAELEAAHLRLEAEKERVKLLAEKTQQQAEQIEALNVALTAEREAKEFLRQSNENKDSQIADLKSDKKQLKKQRNAAGVGGFVTGVLTGVVIRR